MTEDDDVFKRIRAPHPDAVIMQGDYAVNGPGPPMTDEERKAWRAVWEKRRRISWNEFMARAIAGPREGNHDCSLDSPVVIPPDQRSPGQSGQDT